MARQTTHQTEPNKPKNVKRDPIASGERDATFNRAASHNYFLEDKMEAGIVLTGSEVKSVRAGRANLKDGYALLKDGELWLLNAHIGAYENAGYAPILLNERASCWSMPKSCVNCKARRCRRAIP